MAEAPLANLGNRGGRPEVIFIKAPLFYRQSKQGACRSSLSEYVRAVTRAVEVIE